MKIVLDREKVKRLAARRNQSLVELTQGVVDYNHLHRLFRGEHEPTAKVRRRLCERWGASFDDLFTIVEDAEPASVA